jgi:hypothetical protein
MRVKEIIGRFGGQSALAALIGKGQSTVAYWVKAGSIPAKWQSVLLGLAREKGIALSGTDFLEEQFSTQYTSAAETTAPNVVLPAHQAHSMEMSSASQFLFYVSDNGVVKVQVALSDETVWASQKGMGEIFGVDIRTINEHIQNIFKSGELNELSVIRKIRITAADGKNYDTNFYNLDAIISVGYRVNSYQATQFRKWATTVLRSFLIKGFALDDDRLKQGNQLFGKDYFDELLERIREIRASERRFYQKITDIYAQCSIDYDKNSPIAQQFYAHVQDKLHFAIHGHTAAELINMRADSSKPNMGLYAYKNEKNRGKITKQDVTVGKNYLNEPELDALNRLVSMYLDFAENFARRQMAMKMEDWSEKLDGFLRFNAYEVLENFGHTRSDTAKQRALAEFEKYRVVQDQKFKSDFDNIVDEVRTKKRLPKA